MSAGPDYVLSMIFSPSVLYSFVYDYVLSNYTYNNNNNNPLIFVNGAPARNPPNEAYKYQSTGNCDVSDSVFPFPPLSLTPDAVDFMNT